MFLPYLHHLQQQSHLQRGSSGECITPYHLCGCCMDVVHGEPGQAGHQGQEDHEQARRAGGY